jgi:alpha-tubulin suppressor-like RCC1 family protein
MTIAGAFFVLVASIASGCSYRAPSEAMTLWAWGDNSRGQLGVGDLGIHAGPVKVPGLTNLVDAEAGWQHTVGLGADGRVWQWGRDWGSGVGEQYSDYFMRDCADQTTDCHPSPTAVIDQSGVAITDGTAIAAGTTYSLLVRTADHTVWAWGNNASGQLGYTSVLLGGADPRRSAVARAVLNGPDHVLAVDATSGTSFALRAGPPAIILWAWGSNAGGQLGMTLPDVDNEAQLERMQPAPVPGLGADLFDFAGGDQHELALGTNGAVWGWGWNAHNRVTGRSGSDSFVFTPVHPNVFIQGSGYEPLPPIRTVAAGCDHSLALTRDGKLLSWGGWEYGQRGDVLWDGLSHGYSRDEVHEMKPFGGAAIRGISAGCKFSLALLDDGTVWAWGDNSHGQLGLATTETCMVSSARSVPCSTTPMQVPGLTNVNSISAGTIHSVAIARAGATP